MWLPPEDHDVCNEEIDDEYYDDQSYTKAVSCKFCFKTGFTWAVISGKWTMLDNGIPHKCLTEKAAKKKAEVKQKLAEILPLSIDAINELLSNAAKEDRKHRYE